ncbi:MAG: undecaprenyl-diphosphate phosphatase [Deltaproteobacteria bacterium]|nr:undecaprenyl-diphosphate phosphatase [Deltaproteobacteria bacterium]
MNPFLAAILGIVEGITEYLPISSTGHLILASRLLGLEGEGADAFDVVIQLGAILAVVVHYRTLLWERTTGLFAKKPESINLLVGLVVGFLPTAVTGLLLRKKIKALLFGPKPVAFALVAGGILMIVIELIRARRAAKLAPGAVLGDVGIEKVTPMRAFLIGVGQCFSMWPGSSRSMCTIIAGQLTGLSTATAAEFSFLLGLPTLGAATVYEMIKSRAALGAIGPVNVVIGLVVSFLVAWAVVAAFLRYLKSRGLLPFGVYRILVGILVFLLISKG